MLITKFYPYPSMVCGMRTKDDEVIAFAKSVFDLLDRLSIERDNSDGSDPILRRDTVLCRTTRDNKTAIEVKLSSGKVCYIGYYDGEIQIGTTMYQKGRYPIKINIEL